MSLYDDVLTDFGTAISSGGNSTSVHGAPAGVSSSSNNSVTSKSDTTSTTSDIGNLIHIDAILHIYVHLAKYYMN